ncbi:MAG TPA: type II CAAX endopeptidase family protein [Puia sp.]|nr:type II CAAX endopeptidase family protein [Puia sp.]
MSNNLKIRSPWSQLALFMGLFGLSLILGVMGANAIILAKTGISAGGQIDMDNPALLPAKKLAQAFSTVVIFGLPAFIYARKTFNRGPLRSLGLRPADKTVFYVLGIMLLLVALPLEGWLGMLNKKIPLPGWMIRLEKANDQQVVAFLQIHSSFDLLINLFVIAFLPAVFEEMCFRGAMQRILIEVFKSPWIGIVATGFIFSAIHMQFQGFLPRMMLGILLGAAFWYSGSLWTSILAHFFFNGIQVVAASYYPKLMTDNPTVPVYAGLISLVVVVALLSVIRRQSIVTYEKVYNQAENYDDFLSNQS